MNNSGAIGIAFLALIIALAATVILPQHGHLQQNVTDTHREWNWADEQSWTKHITVPIGKPVEYANNPILDVRAGKNDSYWVMAQACLRYNDTYYLFYMGVGGVGTKGRAMIASANTTDFPINWTRYDNVIVDVGAGGSWDQNNINEHSVLIDTEAQQYKMWYCGAAPRQLGYAYCNLTDDPTVQANWVKYAGNHIWSPSGFYNVDGVIKLGNLYYLFWQNSTRAEMFVATSDDGITWNDRGPVFGLGASGYWDDDTISFGTMYWSLGVTYSIYAGLNATVGGRWQIGEALAGPDFLDFTKIMDNNANPILSPSGVADWKGTHVLWPALIMEEDCFYIFFTGYGTHGGVANKYRIGYATIPGAHGGGAREGESRLFSQAGPSLTPGNFTEMLFSVYNDEACTEKTKSIEWGTMKPGDTKEQKVYARNEGDVPIFLMYETENWVPVAAKNDMVLSWDYKNETLKPEEKRALIFTLEVSASAKEQSFDFDIVVIGHEWTGL